MSQSLLLCFDIAGEVKNKIIMASGEIKILENLSINQNVICWVFKLYRGSLCRSEQFMLLVLRCLVSVLAIFHFDNDYIDILHDTLLQEEME